MAIPVLCDAHPGFSILSIPSHRNTGMAIPVFEYGVIDVGASLAARLSPQIAQVHQPSKGGAYPFLCTISVARERLVLREGPTLRVIKLTDQHKGNPNGEIRYCRVARKGL
jgi:hypothetical protein